MQTDVRPSRDAALSGLRFQPKQLVLNETVEEAREELAAATVRCADAYQALERANQHLGTLLSNCYGRLIQVRRQADHACGFFQGIQNGQLTMRRVDGGRSPFTVTLDRETQVLRVLSWPRVHALSIPGLGQYIASGVDARKAYGDAETARLEARARYIVAIIELGEDNVKVTKAYVPLGDPPYKTISIHGQIEEVRLVDDQIQLRMFDFRWLGVYPVIIGPESQFFDINELDSD